MRLKMVVKIEIKILHNQIPVFYSNEPFEKSSVIAIEAFDFNFDELGTFRVLLFRCTYHGITC